MEGILKLLNDSVGQNPDLSSSIALQSFGTWTLGDMASYAIVKKVYRDTKSTSLTTLM